MLGGAALAAVLPDFDLLFDSHRTYSHSIGAAVIAALVTMVFLRKRPDAVVSGFAISAAYASHFVLDWFGKDSSSPPGLMLLWPFSSNYHLSGLDFFREVSRRYWRPEEFIVGNLVAVGCEVMILLPLLLVAWVLWSGSTVRTLRP